MARRGLILRGGAVVGNGVADVVVADGVVAGVGPGLDAGGADELDVAGLVVLPGAIDAHVHLDEPGRTHWEGFATGTAALVAGGVTCCADMPLNAHPPTLDGASFDAKAAAGAGVARVDFALWGGLVPGPLDRLDELAARGVVGFKAFMAASGIDDFAAADDLTLLEGMARAAALGLPVAVHAESDAITGALAARAVAEGRVSARDYAASRPVIAELEAIGRALAFAAETGCALHVVHVSTGRGVALVAAARARGVDVTCETCPHYLVLGEEDLVAAGAALKCAPPLRADADRAELWDRLVAGDVDLVASDHSPAPPELKATEDLMVAWGGLAGAQSTLALLLTEGVATGRLGLAAVARLLCAAPAARFGLAPAKGAIRVGADADLVVVEPGAAWTLATEDLQDRHRANPYAGRRLRGRIRRTLLRGETAAIDGRPVGPPRGRLVRRGL